VADGTKVGVVTLARIADWDAVDVLITTDDADPAELAAIRERDVTVEVV
jgi:DeoR family transcriptional regulator of aga operon